MNRPWKLEVDPAGNLWVSDTRNDRLLYFINPGTKANGADADGLLGAASFEVEGASRIAPGNFSRALGMVFDATGGLWVADHFHHRVLRFDTPAADALANAADPPSMQPFPTGSSGSRVSIAVFSPSPPTDLSPRLPSRSRPAAISGS